LVTDSRLVAGCGRKGTHGGDVSGRDPPREKARMLFFATRDRTTRANRQDWRNRRKPVVLVYVNAAGVGPGGGRLAGGGAGTSTTAVEADGDSSAMTMPPRPPADCQGAGCRAARNDGAAASVEPHSAAERVAEMAADWRRGGVPPDTPTGVMTKALRAHRGGELDAMAAAAGAQSSEKTNTYAPSSGRNELDQTDGQRHDASPTQRAGR